MLLFLIKGYHCSNIFLRNNFSVQIAFLCHKVFFANKTYLLIIFIFDGVFINQDQKTFKTMYRIKSNSSGAKVNIGQIYC